MYSKDKLLKALALPLPGEEAQHLMAPAGRRVMTNSTEEIRNAAVLVPIIKQNAHLKFVLTLRASYDGIHSAQVSFPGGKFERDETNPIDVALREAEEETGIPSKLVQVIGQLSPILIPVSKMRVFPVVGWIEEDFEFKPDRREVSRIITYPLDQLNDQLKQSSKEIYPLFNREIPYFAIDGEKVWGATAMMLSEFLEVLKSSLFIDPDSEEQISK
jgi:8-oxo-dGTP pyrophosphatase MutT (NUDIX family)